MTVPVTRRPRRAPPPLSARLRYWKQALAAYLPVPFSRLYGPRHPHVAGVLTYHRVCARRPGRDLPPLCVTPERMRRQLKGLIDRGYEPWPLSRLREAHAAGELPERPVFAVAFDDGYGCLYESAFPVLRELQVPATIFIPTAWMGLAGPFSFDDWHWAGDPRCVSDWRPLTLSACHTMLQSGVIELGSHGHRHLDFRGNTAGFAADLATSVQFLRQEFGLEAPPFSLPFGAWQDDWLPIVKRAGVSCCLTTECQLIGRDDDPFTWGRFGAEQYDSPATLAAKLDGWYGYLRHGWHVLKRGMPRHLLSGVGHHEPVVETAWGRSNGVMHERARES